MTERERERQAAIYEGEFATQEEKIKALEKEIRQAERDYCYHKGYAEGKRDAMKWISVRERLPERSGSYLVMANWPESEESDMSIVNYDEDAEAFGEWHEEFDRDTLGSLGSEFYSVDVTHWMPLPDPPEVEE